MKRTTDKTVNKSQRHLDELLGVSEEIKAREDQTHVPDTEGRIQQYWEEHPVTPEEAEMPYERLEGMHPGELPGDEGNEPLDGSYPPDGSQDRWVRKQVARTTPSRMLAFERRRRALELRRLGISHKDIARELGYSSAQAVGKAIKSAMESGVQEASTELRAMQYDRLNEMMSRWYPLAIGGRRQEIDESGAAHWVDVPPSLEATKMVASLMAQIDTLMGTQNERKIGTITHEVEGEVTHTHNEGVIVVDFDKDGWKAALSRATQDGLTEGGGDETQKFELQPPAGYIAPALAPGVGAQEDDDVIEGVIVEEGQPAFDPRQAIKLNT